MSKSVNCTDTANDEVRKTEMYAMRSYFKTLALPQLVDIANMLYTDNERLRRELDDKDGVIR